ncbi:MAG: GNAT family N-acetyltransferase [Cyanobacteria bacterium P01_A01_bin.135]
MQDRFTKDKLSTRRATIADSPLLAKIAYEASLPPMNQCFWDIILQNTGTDTLTFLTAMFQAGASNFGDVGDFLILEAQGTPVAAAAGYKPSAENYSPLRLCHLDKLADKLGWSGEVTAVFRDRYLAFWGGDCQPAFLTPYAPWIIEAVAVLPEARGRGFGKVLLQALLAQGQAQHPQVGIMVINGNDRARRLYESLGFRPYQTFHAAYFANQFEFDFPGITKLSLRFDAAGAA